ncbi:MAG: prepilin-type N-terminal cleavage/methylation domain-containing protein [Rickettsiales bacterium]|jgi:prepilin-type N-terminal cleavage/methylation domain-containing protein
MQLEKETKLGFSLIELSVSILIIGLLIVGVSKTSQIIGDGKLLAARSITQNSFPYLNSTKLALWYDATAESSFSSDIEDGDNVGAWNDVNPNLDSNNIDVLAVGTNPIYVSDATNGLPAVRFTQNSQLTKEDVLAENLTEDGEQITIFLVQNYFSPIHASSSFVWNVDGPSQARISTHSLWIDGDIYFNFGICCGGETAAQSTPMQTFTDSTNITSYVRISNDPGNNLGNDSGSIRINGTQIGVTDTITADIDISMVRDFNLGQNINADINELIIFKTALKDSEIQSVERYLSRKWGVELE